MLEPNKYTKCLDSIAPTLVSAFEVGEESGVFVGSGIKKREWRWLRAFNRVGAITGNKRLTLSLQHSNDDGATDPYVDIPGGPSIEQTAAGHANGAKPLEIGAYLPTTPWKHWLRPKVVAVGGTGEAAFNVELYLMHPTRSGFADQTPEVSNTNAQNTGGGAGGDQDVDPGGGGGEPGEPAGAGMRGFIVDWTGFSWGNVSGGEPPGGGDVEGWFEPQQQGGDVIYYLSDSDGSDGDNGLTEGTAKATLAAGQALLADGSADWLLLKCGDTWDTPMPDMPALSGRSELEPIVIGTYGTGARPILSCGTSNGIYLGQAGGVTRRHDNLAFLDLHFSASGGAGNGVNIFGEASGLRFEGCQISSFGGVGFNVGVTVPGQRHVGVTIRRCNILDSQSHGLVGGAVDGWLIEENNWINNGAAGGQFARNVYVDNGCTDVVFRGNLVHGNDGVHLRSGGDAEFNLIMECSHGLQFGAGSQAQLDPGGVTGTCQYNGIFFDHAIDANHIAWGMSIGNVHDTLFYRNIIARNEDQSGGSPLNLNYRNPNALVDTGLVNVTLRECIVANWCGSVVNYSQSTAPWSNVVIEDCDFQATVVSQPIISLNGLTQAKLDSTHCGGNRYFRTGSGSGTAGIFWDTNGNNRTFAQFCADVSGLSPAANDTTSTYEEVAYPDPDRDLGTYHNTLGGTPTTAAFLVAARAQSKQNWNADLLARPALTHIFAGYGITIPEP